MENNDIYLNNLSVLKKKYSEIYDYVSVKENIEDIFWDKSGADEDIMAINRMNRLYYLNSRYSDDEFSDKWAEQYKKVNYKAVFVIFGLSNFSYIKKLLAHTGRENLFLIYEPDKQIFAKAIEKADIAEILERNNIFLCVKELNDDYLAEFIVLAMDYARINLVKYCCMPNYDELYPNEWKSVIKSIKERFEIVIMSRNTEIYFAKEFVKNIILNCRDMVNEYSMSQLKDAFRKLSYIQKVPAIIVSAGPSLDKNISELKQAKGKSLIIAVDTAIKSLLKNDIIPDLLITVDPHKPPILFMNPKFKDIPMVVCAYSNCDLWVLHNGKRFYFAEEKSYMSDLFKSVTGKTMQSTESGGSVANNAFSLAQVLGFKTIIFVGQDLAYVGKKLHASGAYGDTEKDKIAKNKKYIEVEDIYGDKVLTENNMNLYRKWFETQIVRYPELKVIDATEGGAKIEGTEIITLKEAIERECITDEAFDRVIDNIERPINENDAEKLLNEIDNIAESLDTAKKEIKKGIRKYEKLEELSRKGKTNGAEFKKIVTEIDEITKYVEDEPILELANTYERFTEYEVLGTVYNTKDEVRDEIRDITNSGIKMLNAYIKGIDMLLNDVKKEKEISMKELLININEILKNIAEIESYEKEGVWLKVNEHMKPLYKSIVRSINILMNIEDSEAKSLKQCLGKIVEIHTEDNMEKLTEIINGELRQFCSNIKKEYE